jgi:hypothetical protein
VVYFGGFFAKLGYFARFSLNHYKKAIKNYKVKNLGHLVAKGHKNTNAPLIFENLGYYFFFIWANYIMGHFSGFFEGASTFLTQFRGQKSLGPLEISLEKAHYVVCPQKKIISRIFKISGALIVNIGSANTQFLLT